MQARLFDLDHGAAGIGQPVIFLIERLGEGEDLIAAVLVKAARGLPVEHLATAASHFYRLGAQALGRLPDGVILQRARLDGADYLGRKHRCDELVHDVASRAGALRKAAAMRADWPGCAWIARRQALHAVERIAEPRTTADIDVEAHFTITDDIEPGADLIADQRRDCITVLLAIDCIAVERLEKRPAPQVFYKPLRSRQRAGDGGRKRRGFGGDEHNRPPRILPHFAVRRLECTSFVILRRPKGKLLLSAVTVRISHGRRRPAKAN